MATTLLLVRHAAHGRVGSVLCGRMPDVHLSEAGRGKAVQLASALGVLDAVYTSPQPRAVETAASCGAAVPCDALDEIDFGEWTGLEFAALAADPRWRDWNDRRATAIPPGGESMEAAQLRIMRWMAALPSRHPDGRVAAFSHADVIKAALAGTLGLSLDAHGRFDIDPASVSAVALWEGGGKVLEMNRTMLQ